MSENNNKNDFNKDDLTEQFNTFVNKAVKTVQTVSKKTAEKISIEKQKAEVRSEIGHTSRELSKAYEKLGRAYFDAKESNTAIELEKETFDIIRAKEKLVELLNDKLDHLS